MQYFESIYHSTEKGIAINLHPWLPSKLGCIEVLRVKINSTYRIIVCEDFARQLIVVRTDVYPLLWLWWWFVYRLEESGKVCRAFIVHLAQVWGLAYIRPGTITSWKDLGRRKQVN